ncbi:MAG: hypothetical protein ACJ8BC_06295, partial [Gemmatimonadales bacterium]
MGRHVAQGERFLRLKAQVLAQLPGALDIAEGRVCQLLEVAGLVVAEARGLARWIRGHAGTVEVTGPVVAVRFPHLHPRDGV